MHISKYIQGQRRRSVYTRAIQELVNAGNQDIIQQNRLFPLNVHACTWHSDDNLCHIQLLIRNAQIGHHALRATTLCRNIVSCWSISRLWRMFIYSVCGHSTANSIYNDEIQTVPLCMTTSIVLSQCTSYGIDALGQCRWVYWSGRTQLFDSICADTQEMCAHTCVQWWYCELVCLIE